MPTLKGSEASLPCVSCILSILQYMSLFFIILAGYFLDRPSINNEEEDDHDVPRMHGQRRIRTWKRGNVSANCLFISVFYMS